MPGANIKRIPGTVMDVNSYLVEQGHTIVVVDGMLTVSDARAVRTHIDQSGKVLAGLVVTHAHPDHYAGAAEILRGRPEVPIVATEAVRRAIERDDAVKNAIVGPMMGDEWPTQRQFPNQTVVGSVELGSLSFSVRDVGAAESPADSLWFLDERSIFVGDLVYNGLHAYLADGHFEGWLACLDQMQSSLARGATLYVGHGQPGGVELLAAQKRYVEAFVASVQANLGKDPDARRTAVVSDMKRLLPTDGLSFLMELSVDPVAANLEAGPDSR